MKKERFILLPVPRRGIFAECNKNPQSTVNNIPFLFELDPAVDIPKLSHAIAKMVNAHSYLLTQVYLDDKGVMGTAAL